MPLFRQLERSGFDGIEFPVREVTVECELRRHHHKFPKRPGSRLEKLGRGPYIITMGAEFHATLPGYPGLWPESLGVLRTKFDRELTSELVIPTIGGIQATCVKWKQTQDANIRSGEAAQFVFEEDDDSDILDSTLVDVEVTSLAKSTQSFANEKEEIQPQPDIFERILDAANSLLAFRDQADLYAGLLESRIAQVTNLIREADRTLEVLQNPVNYRVVYALHDMLDAATELAKTLTEQALSPRTWIAPVDMTLATISQAIYGDSQKAAELLRLNALEDPFNVRAGTEVKYVPSEEAS